MSGNLTFSDPAYTAASRAAVERSASYTGRPSEASQRSADSEPAAHTTESGGTGTGTGTAEIDYSRQPTIRIQRQASRQSVRGSERSDVGYFGQNHGRKRSTSDPVRRDFATPGADLLTPKPARHPPLMPGIEEGVASGVDSIQPVVGGNGEGSSSNAPPLRRAGPNIAEKGDYEDNLIDFLDLVDPEVSTLTTLTNVQNSLFVPDLGKYLNRRPTYILSRRPTKATSVASTDDATEEEDEEAAALYQPAQARPQPSRLPTTATLNTISSRVNERYFAVLPHGCKLEGWSEEDKLELNDHVRHMLHSRRSRFKRSMKGFGQYVRKPLGFFVTLYALLITIFGLVWVLFLIGWIYDPKRNRYVIHIVDSVLVALFAIVGDGLAPFRAVDTYHMCFIAHYHHLTWRLRREKALPKLQNRSDLPPLEPGNADPEKQEISVLSPAQQKKLEHHQKKFARSHSFYKPHETGTHQAFSLRLLIAIVVLLDCHSFLQISLGATTWGIDYKTRPMAITTVILCCSITVNLVAGVLISVGDHRSRKKEVIEKMFRQQLTEEAIEKVEKKRKRELKKALKKKGLESELQLRQEASEPLSTLSLPTHTTPEERGEVEASTATRS